jgi:hypothetical protein
MSTRNWDRVEQRLDELKDIALYRTTVAAMKRVLPKLRADLHDTPPFVSHASLSFPGSLQCGVSLDWDEEHEGYTISLVLSDGNHAATKRVAEDQLAEVIRAYLERCSQPTPTSLPAPTPASTSTPRSRTPKTKTKTKR